MGTCRFESGHRRWELRNRAWGSRGHRWARPSVTGLAVISAFYNPFADNCLRAHEACQARPALDLSRAPRRPTPAIR
jgi:hypothetical protein